MNYRHAYHAGNFADCVKHIILTLCIVYMQRKEQAFRVLDTHAGPGLYDLAGEAAQKTGEWRGGVSRLLEAETPSEVAELIAPWRDIVREIAGTGELPLAYPGSPLIVRKLLRPQDRLSAIELLPQDAAALKALFAGDHQVRVTELDGWLALKGHLPPKEKRGLVLIDPPYEKRDDFDTMAKHLAAAWRRFPGGVYLLWYPVKNRAAVATFRTRLAGLGIPRILDTAVEIRGVAKGDETFDGTGMAIVNPPHVLLAQLQKLLPWLTNALAVDSGATFRLEWLAGEGTGGAAAAKRS